MTRTNERNAEVLLGLLAAGRTVYIATHYRVTKITPKVAQRWIAAGRPVLKNDTRDGHLMLGSGRSYVDCQYTDVFVSEAR